MYQNQVTLSRPAGVAWFQDVDPSTNSAYKTWLNSQSGFVSHASQVDPDTRDVNIVQTWSDQASYDAMVLARQSNAAYIAKKDYEASVGIVTTLIYRGEV